MTFQVRLGRYMLQTLDPEPGTLNAKRATPKLYFLSTTSPKRNPNLKLYLNPKHMKNNSPKPIITAMKTTVPKPSRVIPKPPGLPAPRFRSAVRDFRKSFPCSCWFEITRLYRVYSVPNPKTLSPSLSGAA